MTTAGHETELTYVNADGCVLVEAYLEKCGDIHVSLPSAASGSLHGIAKHVAAATHLYLQQQAAACMASPGCLPM